jgi:GTPase SAR1 family protein
VSEELNSEETNMVDPEIQSEPSLSVISLPLGESLTFEDIYSITSIEPAVFVVIAGPIGCGKTTLITSLYQKFLKEPFDQHYFAGSQTLQAFESRAYLTRVTSNQATPQTPRTPRGALDSILHLRIWDSLQNIHNNLLLTDFSGEDYANITANIQLAKEEFTTVKAAQAIVMLIDGEKISTNRNRHSELQRTIHILRTFFDADLINLRARIIIAISKYDIVYENCANYPERKQYIDNLSSKISEQIPDLESSRLHFCFIAAMPNNSENIHTGYGLPDFLNLLLSPNKEHKRMLSPTVTPISEFNLLNERM